MPTLLVGDASSNIHRIVELTFSGHGIRVVAVSDGEQVLARVAVDPPDIVLVDIAIPSRSGYDVCASIKERQESAHIPVLLSTGAFEPIDQERAQQARCNGILVKPFDPQQLVARVRELLSGRGDSSASVIAGVPRAVDRLGLRGPGGSRTGFVRIVDESNAIDHFHSEASMPDPALDEYFERLDSALTRRKAEPPASTKPDIVETRADGSERAPEPEVPTLDRVLGPKTEPPISDAMIDEIANRVAKRLASDSIDRVVADVVADIAERRVREEIARIRKR